MKKIKGLGLLAISVFFIGTLSSCSTMKGKKCDCPRFGYEQPADQPDQLTATTEEFGA